MAPMARHMDEQGRALSWPDDSPGGSVLARTKHGRTVVELHGEIDLAVVLATTPQLYALTTASRPRIVADLRQVTFIDCSGLAMLVDVRSRVLASDGAFTMVCADPRVLRLLRITGLLALLAPVAELPEPEAGPEARTGPASGSEEGAAPRAEVAEPGTEAQAVEGAAEDDGSPGAEEPGTRKGRET